MKQGKPINYLNSGSRVLEKLTQHMRNVFTQWGISQADKMNIVDDAAKDKLRLNQFSNT